MVKLKPAMNWESCGSRGVIVKSTESDKERWKLETFDRPIRCLLMKIVAPETSMTGSARLVLACLDSAWLGPHSASPFIFSQTQLLAGTWLMVSSHNFSVRDNKVERGFWKLFAERFQWYLVIRWNDTLYCWETTMSKKFDALYTLYKFALIFQQAQPSQPGLSHLHPN